MKGFKKDGKFRPTGNKSKSSLKKSDVKRIKGNMDSGSQKFDNGSQNPNESSEDAKYELKVKKEKIEQIKRISDLEKRIDNHWYSSGDELNDDDDGLEFWHIFTSKKDHNRTMEIHYNEVELEPELPDHPDTEYLNDWYWFSAYDGKGDSSIDSKGEGGGYTVHDAYESFLDDVIDITGEADLELPDFKKVKLEDRTVEIQERDDNKIYVKGKVGGKAVVGIELIKKYKHIDHVIFEDGASINRAGLTDEDLR